jgi:hypothetical protein
VSRERLSLPDDLDGEAIAPQTDDALEQAGDDERAGKFYRGVIVFLDRVRGRGAIRSASGREIRFEFPFVAVIGAPLGGRAPGLHLLRQGDTVGFDVGWTSRGLRITQIQPSKVR